MISRKKFIESLGGSCANWAWAWSFVNHGKRFVIFGAWTSESGPHGDLILSTDWEYNGTRRNNGFNQSLEHIALVEDGYALFTFPMEREEAHPGTDKGTAKIKAFLPELKQRDLTRIGNEWFASNAVPEQGADEVQSKKESTFPEGALRPTIVNGYERSPKARALCLAKYGFKCVACDLNLEDRYGEVARNFIHVHHLVRVAEMGDGYEVDPIEDLRPVCPNCHSIIHLRDPMFSIEEVRHLIQTEARDGGTQ